jgi:hypothetical protein
MKVHMNFIVILIYNIRNLEIKIKRPTRGCSRPGLRPGVKAPGVFVGE